MAIVPPTVDRRRTTVRRGGNLPPAAVGTRIQAEKQYGCWRIAQSSVGDDGNRPSARLVGAEPELSDGVLAHFVFQDLAGGVHREIFDKIDVARDFVLCHIG